jgi:hypothetical protein
MPKPHQCPGESSAQLGFREWVMSKEVLSLCQHRGFGGMGNINAG